MGCFSFEENGLSGDDVIPTYNDPMPTDDDTTSIDDDIHEGDDDSDDDDAIETHGTQKVEEGKGGEGDCSC